MNIKFANIPLRNRLVAASSPLTESEQRIDCCYQAGFGAVILKSCADYKREKKQYNRKIFYTKPDEYYAYGSLEQEILTLNEGLELYKKTAHYNYIEKVQNKMLIIPSVAASSLDAHDWVTACNSFQSLGAKLIQLDFFYLGSLKHNDAFFEEFRSLLITLRKEMHCKLMPKLNPMLPPEKICRIIAESGIGQVSLIDSLRAVPPSRSELPAEGTSYFGKKLLGLSLYYLISAVNCGMKVCAGGGVNCAEDIDLLRRNGASLVQTASYILTHGFSALTSLTGGFTSSSISHHTWCDIEDDGICRHCGACMRFDESISSSKNISDCN